MMFGQPVAGEAKRFAQAGEGNAVVEAVGDEKTCFYVRTFQQIALGLQDYGTHFKNGSK